MAWLGLDPRVVHGTIGLGTDVHTQNDIIFRAHYWGCGRPYHVEVLSWRD